MISEIRSRENTHVRHMRKLQSSKKYRYERKEYVLEGEKVLREALSGGAPVRSVFLTRKAAEKWNEEELSAIPEVFLTDDRILGHIADTETPQGVVFSVAMPETSFPERPEGTLIILDAVRDPGNLGTIIRTAEAFGLSCLILTEDCADVFSPKVTRSTMGALLRIPAVYASRETILAEVRASGRKLIVTALENDARTLKDIPLAGQAVVLGNEANGVSAYFLQNADCKAIIPMKGETPSLNVAVSAGIVLYEMSRQE